MWDERYGSEDFMYGTMPNDFLAQVCPRLEPGLTLCIAEGEGRNAVYLAGQGHEVTAMDASAVGMAKAQQLGQQRGVQLRTVVADLAHFDVGQESWDNIVSIFGHMPSKLRKPLNARLVKALKPGGHLIIESYSPAQIPRTTGGPKDPDMMPGIEDLKKELAGLKFEVAHEIVRDVHEGRGHTGEAVVVQVLAIKP